MTLKNPALNGAKGFLLGAGVFASQVAWKLDKTFGELLEHEEGIIDGETLTLTDKAIPTVVELKLQINSERPMDESQ